jgi:hypothetical protein
VRRTENGCGRRAAMRPDYQAACQGCNPARRGGERAGRCQRTVTWRAIPPSLNVPAIALHANAAIR